MTILNNAAANECGLDEEPDGEHNKRRGFTSKAALQRLDEDISKVLHEKESVIRNERYSQEFNLLLSD